MRLPSAATPSLLLPLLLLILPTAASAQQQLRRPAAATTNPLQQQVAYVSADGSMGDMDLSSLTAAQNESLHVLYDFLVARGGLESGPAGRRQLQAAGRDTNAMLFPLVQIVLDPRGVSDRSPSKHWLFPACGFAEPIVDSPGYCPLGWLVENGAEVNYALNRRGFINVRTIYGTEKQPAQVCSRWGGGGGGEGCSSPFLSSVFFPSPPTLPPHSPPMCVCVCSSPPSHPPPLLLHISSVLSHPARAHGRGGPPSALPHRE